MRSLGVCVCFVCFPTLLPGSVENLDVFQLHTNTSPELHSIRSIVFAASLNGAIGMSPKQKTTNPRVN